MIGSRLHHVRLNISINPFLLTLLSNYKITNTTECVSTINFKIDRFSRIHISPYLHRFHWLPIKFRIIFKVLLLTHNSLHHNRPEYLSSFISIPTHTISLRSTTSYLLHLPSKLNLHTTNIRAWHISAPYLWNKLPHNLRSTQSTTSFKSLFKIDLFTIAFP